MTTYAPLFAHVEGWQWRLDMIWFNNINCVRTASYYVQQLYAHNKSANTLSLTMNRQNVIGAEGQNSLFASAVWNKNDNCYIVKIANTSDKTLVQLNFAGLKKNEVLSDGKRMKLSAADPELENTIKTPDAIILYSSIN